MSGQNSAGLNFKNGNIGIADSDPGTTLSFGRNASSNPGISINSGTKSYFHSALSAQNNYVRSAITNNIHWIDADNTWHVEGPVNSDFSMIAYENEGEIAIYNRPTTGSAYTIANSDLQAYRRMTIKKSGNIGIGTSTPDSKLTVNGVIHTNEVRVDLNIPGPDYVFEEQYKLGTLKELEAYIAKYHHLPEVPSAKEMADKGINLGEMNTLLLKKIEELTLHLIQKEKQLKKQQEDIDLIKIKLGLFVKP
ncbi:hypothetical protein [Mucilaginibacter glaciei]|uniref:Peptidase S74 domain-containing protein n=1 Tax=Mucilaginibacter glaciei TaxID=2772109 RepID=A0A926S861_9SPHI|nr:hypothetical protein [Mucilaginibacter glaciei]MBD1395441.1 hypothetical protein [Mucilaginibacter glaciei]